MTLAIPLAVPVALVAGPMVLVGAAGVGIGVGIGHLQNVASKKIHPRKGGTIQLPGHEIDLIIPVPGLRTECKITLKVLPQPPIVLFEDTEATVFACVVCEPSKTTFEKPFMLVLPHCAVLTDPSKAKVNMYFTDGDKKVAKRELSSTGTPRCVVKEHVLEVYSNHFLFLKLFMVISDNFNGKIIASTPYLPKSMSRLQQHYCHLRLYNNTPGLEKLIETEEDKLGYCKMAPTKIMSVLREKGELKIRCEVEVEGGLVSDMEKTVSLDDIYKLERNVLYFLVKATGEADVHIKFNFQPHCDEGHAFKMKFSGITEAPRGNTVSKFPELPLLSQIRKVSDEMLNDLAKEISSNDYNTFSEKLGIGHNQARNIVVEYGYNYANATRDCLEKWKNRSTRTVADLHEVLRGANLAGLIVHCN